jgi:hypothetical protein
VRRGVRNFLRARLAEVDRRLAKLRLHRTSIRSWESPTTAQSYDYRERRLSKMRAVILERLRYELLDQKQT